MEPEAVAGLEIGDFGDRQRLALARDLHFDARAEEIEIVVVGAGATSGHECDGEHSGERDGESLRLP